MVCRLPAAVYLMEQIKVAKAGNRLKTLLLSVIIVATLSGCGGGGSTGGGSNGGGGGDTVPAQTLSWAPPTSYTDTTPLNPATDLDRFEIYVNGTGTFTAADTPIAVLAAVDRGIGQVTTSFNLANLSPFLARGIPYQVSIRAVAINGEKSDFSQPATFFF